MDVWRGQGRSFVRRTSRVPQTRRVSADAYIPSRHITRPFSQRGSTIVNPTTRSPRDGTVFDATSHKPDDRFKTILSASTPKHAAQKQTRYHRLAHRGMKRVERATLVGESFLPHNPHSCADIVDRRPGPFPPPPPLLPALPPSPPVG